ncbi:YHS domain-containing protein [Streptomyces nigra]|uniref:YHS domain-containing protein n=1 Tax=Streptomyces nigra TaxID=1827580 RepID=UPI0034168B80
MALSSLSVVTNASRLRRWHTQPLSGAQPARVQPRVEFATDRSPAGASAATEHRPAPYDHAHEHHPHGSAVTDPVCGMSIDKAFAAQSRNTGTGTGTYYFCSAHCAAAFDADPERYTGPLSGGMSEGGEHR